MSAETDEYRRVLLLYVLGDNGSRVVESSERYRTDKSLDAILNILEQYCIGESNVVHERYKSNSRNQAFDTFYTEIKSLAARCSFTYRQATEDESLETTLNKMLRDRIVLGILNDSVRKRPIFSENIP